jgi:predicted SAM-dependent methyltransferase
MVPGGLLSQLAFELRASWKSALNRRYAKRYKEMHGVRLNVGCGSRPTDGWINFDMISDPRIEFWDCRKGLPFSDSAVATIFTEHFLEHLEYTGEVERFLRECLRCLSPSGVLRIVVPDAGVYLKLYCDGAWDKIAGKRPLVKEGDCYRDVWLGERYSTKMEFINAVFRQNGEHKYAYDAETLIYLLRRVGFATVSQTSFGISSDAHMAPDTLERRSDSLYVEAVKQ